jgi:Tol biopolymer transport system component
VPIIATKIRHRIYEIEYLVIPTMTAEGESVVWTVRPDGQELRRVYSEKGAVSAVCWSPGGDALYIFTGQKLVRLPLTESAAAAPEPLVSGLPASEQRCSVSADGQQLLHVRRSTNANLWRLDLGPPTPRVTSLTSGTSSYASPSLSPDRQWVVVSRSPGTDILKIPLDGGEPIPLGQGVSPVLSPDGQRLAFVLNRGSASGVWVSDGDGRGRTEVVDAAVTNPLVTWLPDGRVAWQTPDARNYRIRDLATGEEELLMKEPAVGWVFMPRFSPKGDQVALYWNRADARGLWLLSWPAREGRLVAPNMVDPIGWSPDGEWIYANVSGSAAIFRVSVRNGTVDSVGTLPIGSLGMDSCSLSPDAHVLVCSANEAKADAWLIEHFDPNPRR